MAWDTHGSNIIGFEFRAAIGDRFYVIGFKFSFALWPMAFATTLTRPLVPFEYPYPEPGPVSPIPECPRMFGATKASSTA